MSISTALSSVKNNFSKYLVKGAGVAALGVVAYDAHVLGKLQSDVYSKSKDADACMDAFSNTQYLSSPSITTANLKNTVFDFEVKRLQKHFDALPHSRLQLRVENLLNLVNHKNCHFCRYRQIHLDYQTLFLLILNKAY